MARDCYDDCIAFLDDQLGRLLDELRRPGAPRQHGGDHHLGPWRSVRRSWHLFGHGTTLYLDEIGVPLVILSPAAPAGRVVVQPRQPARPAGDRGRPAGALGRLAVPGPLAGGLLAVGTRSSRPGITSPALSEQADATAFQPSLGAAASTRVPDVPGGSGHHYIRRRHGARAALRPAGATRLSGSTSWVPRRATRSWRSSGGCSSRC